MKPITYRYRVHDTDGDDLGVIRHAAPNVETGDIVVTDDDRHWSVTRYVENRDGDVVHRALGSSGKNPSDQTPTPRRRSEAYLLVRGGRRNE